MSKRFMVAILAVLLILAGAFWVTHHKASAPSPSGHVALSNHTDGGGKSGVLLIEYGDFQCPACYQYFPLVEHVRTQFKDDITFQFRNFPLIEVHQFALLAARAAEAANMQGKFWEMYNQLYTNQPQWSRSSDPTPFFESYASQLGLNLDKFRQDIKGDETNSIVQADRAEAERLGFNSTPTFVLDGTKVDPNPTTQDAFDKLISNEIAKKTGH